jgi:hypothetical protein
MELAFVPLTAREVVQLSDTDRNKIQLSVLIPLTVGEVIQPITFGKVFYNKS